MTETPVAPRRAGSAATIAAPGVADVPTTPGPAGEAKPSLLRIQEVAAATGLTPRSIRYYEEMGLLRPAARSEGDYRLYDPSDLERLAFIRDLRDHAGFSLAEIRTLLEDEAARIRDNERFRASGDPVEKTAILHGLIDRVDRQIVSLEEKTARIRSMIDAARARRDHLLAHVDELGGGVPAHDSSGRPRR